MGWDTYLFVGDRLLQSWRKHAPSEPALLFRSTDLQTRDAQDGECCVVRYDASADAVCKTLDSRGITWEFCCRSYRDSGAENGWIAGLLEGRWHGILEMEKCLGGKAESKTKKLRARAKKMLDAKRAPFTPGDDLRAFARYLLDDWREERGSDETPPLVYCWMDSSWSEQPATGAFEIALAADDAADPDALKLGRAAAFFDELHAQAPLVCWLILLRVLLEVTDGNTEVTLDLSDDAQRQLSDGTVESVSSYVNAFWTGSAAALAKSASRYARLHGAIEGAASATGPEYFRSRARAILQDCETEGDRNAKGKLLEDLIEAVVGISGDDFFVIERNLKTPEEELDVVIANRCADPFWVSLHSPTIFVEAKNWSTPVGINELRVFESKLQDHHSLCRVGIFVAFAGVTAPFRRRLRELQSRDRIVFLLSRDDLVAAIDHPKGLPGWVEDNGLRQSIGRGQPER